jgi:Protein of unknown function (DUF2992)
MLMNKGDRKHSPVGSPDAPHKGVVSFLSGCPLSPMISTYERTPMLLTVYFDGQFWIAVAEDESDEGIQAVHYVFGPEPQDAEIYAFVNQILPYLFRQTRVMPADNNKKEMHDAHYTSNPKRRAREAAASTRVQGISTRSQQAIKDAFESMKKERKEEAREQQIEEYEHKREIKRAKSKERHRGH